MQQQFYCYGANSWGPWCLASTLNQPTLHIFFPVTSSIIRSLYQNIKTKLHLYRHHVLILQLAQTLGTVQGLQ